MSAKRNIPVCIGEVTEMTRFGPVTMPMALVIQRHLSRKGEEMWRIACPRCGCIHEHGAGEGGRGLHCGAAIKDRGDYYIIGGNGLTLLPDCMQADADLRKRGW